LPREKTLVLNDKGICHEFDPYLQVKYDLLQEQHDESQGAIG